MNKYKSFFVFSSSALPRAKGSGGNNLELARLGGMGEGVEGKLIQEMVITSIIMYDCYT